MNKVLLIIVIFIQIAWSNTADYNKFSYNMIKDVKIGWMNGYTIRYFNTFDSLCLGFIDSLYPEKQKGIKVLKIYDTIPLCNIDGKSTADGYTEAFIMDLKFEQDSIHVLISTTPLEPRGEEIRKCTIYVDNGEFSELKCDEPKPINTLTSDQLKL